MQTMRHTYMYNKDIPGNVEDIHPNKFLASKIKNKQIIKILYRKRSLDILQLSQFQKETLESINVKSKKKIDTESTLKLKNRHCTTTVRNY
jgi:hypothetical protein